MAIYGQFVKIQSMPLSSREPWKDLELGEVGSKGSEHGCNDFALEVKGEGSWREAGLGSVALLKRW